MSTARIPLSADDVARAAVRLRPHLAPTPLRECHALAAPGVLLKLECWQPTGSFKVRGATNFLLSLDARERARGVVAASAGNHALGVAFAASRLGGSVAATLFVPETAPRAKLEKLRRFPVSVVEAGADYDAAAALAHAHAERTGGLELHAFEDARTAAGQGTVGVEILEACPEVEAILVPVGGGGLIAGIAEWVKARAPRVRVVAVQPEASPALAESIRLGRALLTFPARPTLADGVAGGIGEVVFERRHLIDAVVSVSEAEIEAAIVALLARDQVVAEASGALGVAALLARKLEARGGPIVAVVTGGNVDLAVLRRLLAGEA